MEHVSPRDDSGSGSGGNALSIAAELARLADAFAAGGRLEAADSEALRTLAAQVAACEREWALDRRRGERRARLESLLPRLAESLDVREVFAELSELIREVIPHDVLAFALLLPDRSGVRVQAATAAGVIDLPVYRFSNADEALDANWQFLLGYDLEPLDAHSVRARISPRDAAEPQHVVVRPGPQWMRFITQAGVRSTMRVPIRAREYPIGGIAFMSRQPDAFDAEDGVAAQRVADQFALSLAHQKLAERQRLRDRLAALEAALPQLDTLHEPGEIAQRVAQIVGGILDFHAVGVFVSHSGGGTVSGFVDGRLVPPHPTTAEFVASQFEPLMPSGAMRVLDIEVLDEARRLVRQHKAIGGERVTSELVVPEAQFQALQQVGSRSELRVAVGRGDESTGVLLFASKQPDFYTESDVEVARRVAERISLRLAQEREEGARRQAREASALARQLEARVAALQQELERFSAHRAIGQSAAWKKALADATQVAATETTVLVTGESGTGKEVIARYIHRGSQRAKGPFVALNCAALPEQLLESELFGHERGAFTGAIEARAGKIEQAQGGVLFLDEVGEMSPSVQAKFLRVLQEREFQRVGGSKVLRADVRIVAATNRDPRAAIAAGQFREDLYYRLGVFEIHLPPLRERPEDIMVLAQAFLAEVGESIGRPAAGISLDAQELLGTHGWPGNVRELRNAIERAVILCHGGLVTSEHLPISVARDPRRTASALASPDDFPAEGVQLEALEKTLLEKALARASGNKSLAAKLLGLTRGQVYSLLKRHGLTDARR